MDWRSEMAIQNEHLRKQLDALRRGPRERWRCFRLHEVVCGGCGDTLVEVMDTDPYPVAFSRRMQVSNAEAALGPTPTPPSARRSAASGCAVATGHGSRSAIHRPHPTVKRRVMASCSPSVDAVT
jgi:hypothetical protein